NNNYRNNSEFWERGVWLCPSVKSKGILGADFNSYGYNAYGLGTNFDSFGLGGHHGFALNTQIGTPPVVNPPVAASDIIAPSDMMAIGDGFHGNGSEIFSGQSLLWRHTSY